MLPDLINQAFGTLTVIRRVGSQGRNSLWQCECACGNIILRYSKHLLAYDNQSCGCNGEEQSDTPIQPRRIISRNQWSTFRRLFESTALLERKLFEQRDQLERCLNLTRKETDLLTRALVFAALDRTDDFENCADGLITVDLRYSL
jgi:hypothetical protein